MKRGYGLDAVAGRRGRRWLTTLLLLLVPLGGCATAREGQKAPWTIQCLEAHGPEQIQQLPAVADALRRTPGIRPDEVFVHDHGDGTAGVFYGSYHRVHDPQTGRYTFSEQMRTDLNLLRELGDEAGRRYFVRALPVRKPMPDVGNPEWALSQVRAKYTLQVAAFEPTEDFWDFKQAAAEYCAFLREREYEAYYHHGRALSIVTVGAFGADAVVTGVDGRPYYSREVQHLQEDELLRYNVVNGAIHRVRNDEGEWIPVYSRLVKVPQQGEEGT